MFLLKIVAPVQCACVFELTQYLEWLEDEILGVDDKVERNCLGCNITQHQEAPLTSKLRNQPGEVEHRMWKTRSIEQ